jgi:hypothetical protein
VDDGVNVVLLLMSSIDDDDDDDDDEVCPVRSLELTRRASNPVNNADEEEE